jgi:ParB-like chromosome segregation protein Spo0J
MSSKNIEGTKRTDGYSFDPYTLVIIGLDTKDGPDHPLFDVTDRHKSIDRGMVESIKAFGCIEPISFQVTKQSDGSTRCEVVQGRRRVIHARIAQDELRTKDPSAECRVKGIKVSGAEDFELVGINVVTNEQRLNDDPLTKARKAKKMLSLKTDGASSRKEVAAAFGITQVQLGIWLKTLELDSSVLKMVESGELNFSSAAALTDVPKDQQQLAAKELRDSTPAEKQPTVDQARRKAAEKTGKQVGLSLKTIRAITLLIEADRQDEIGSGMKISDDVYDMLRIICGTLNPTKMKGMSELINRAESGEKP